MMAVGGVLIYLAIAKEYEPVLLLPIGLGAILANIPAHRHDRRGGAASSVLYDVGIENELFPLLIFIGIGAMTDFGPLLENPQTGAPGRGGAVRHLRHPARRHCCSASSINEAASIGIIGAADGPTSIYVASALAPNLLAPIAVAAYSYMSLVPIIQPPVMRAAHHPGRAHDPDALHHASRSPRTRASSSPSSSRWSAASSPPWRRRSSAC